MTRARLIISAVLIAIIGLLATPASAQDGPTITVEPMSVDAAGEQEFTVAGAGWTATPPIFVLPCFTVSTIEELSAEGAGACDTAALTPTTPADGAFEVTVTYDVPAEGMCIASGDAAQTEAAFVCIAVGGTDEGGEETEEAEPMPISEDEGGDELANTGVESGLLAIIAVAIVAAGAMVVGATRRFA